MGGLGRLPLGTRERYVSSVTAAPLRKVLWLSN